MSCTTAKRGFGFFEESPERMLLGPADSGSPLAPKRCRMVAPPAGYHARVPAAAHAAAAAAAAADGARGDAPFAMRRPAMKHRADGESEEEEDSDSDDDARHTASAFQPRAAPAPLESVLSQRQRKKLAKARAMSMSASPDHAQPVARAMGHDAAAAAAASGAAGDGRLFTVREVEEIVRQAVGQREEELRQLFARELQDKLTEQFNQFSKFNEDYLHKRLEESPFSYMS